jgi:predicted hydrocarbon binding protein
LKFAEVFFTASGFGLLQNIQLDFSANKAIVNVSNSAVALLLKGKARLACDHLLRGILAGIFSAAFKQDIECVESKCLALNNNACEFVCEPAGNIDFSSKEAREQLELKL